MPGLTFLAYALLSGGLLWSVFARVFPTAYIEGSGLTDFKIFSEYIISWILILSLVFLWRYRNKFNQNAFYLIIASVIISIFSEVAFTFYISVYGLSNLLGHLLKIIAFLLFFKAIMLTRAERKEL